VEQEYFFVCMRYATVGVGFIAAFLSFSLFAFFIKSKRPIGKAVGLMLLGESIGLAVTIAFSITSEGVFDIMNPQAAMAMRWVMFLVAMTTSIHLAYQTWKISE